MNPYSGAIAEFETEEDAKEAGYVIPLPDDTWHLVKTMPRHKRLEWWQSKHAFAIEPGESVEDTRKIRNDRKRKRRARR